MSLDTDATTCASTNNRSFTEGLTTPLPLVEESKSTARLILSTALVGGLQIAWSVELANISPFLLSLGLEKSVLALVWIAGPLAGTVVQPYVGNRSDNCRIRWGRRKPFMICGAFATIFSLLALACTKDIVEAFMYIFEVGDDSTYTVALSQAFAVLSVYILDFSINVIQAAIRAFIVDCAPVHQQEDASSWASRIGGLGNIVGYLLGFIHLPEVFPWLGASQFEALVLITCFIISITLAISCLSVRERDPRLLGPPPQHERQSVLGFFQSVPHVIQRLPLQIRQVCVVQIFAWIGWFPFLFYTSTYVSGIYAEAYLKTRPDLTVEEIDMIWERGTRVGNFSLLLFAMTSFLASIFLPLFITPTYRPAINVPQPTIELQTFSDSTQRRTLPDRAVHNASSREPGKPNSRIAYLFAPCIWLFGAASIPSFTLRRAWLASHLCFAALMFLTIFAHDIMSASIIVALVGFPWAVTNWVPYALIAIEVSKSEALQRGHHPAPAANTATIASDENADREVHAGQAGLVFGIHNVAIAAPQIIATLASSLVFSVLQKPRGIPGDDSVGWVLRLGGLCALAAAWYCRRICNEVVRD